MILDNMTPSHQTALRYAYYGRAYQFRQTGDTAMMGEEVAQRITERFTARILAELGARGQEVTPALLDEAVVRFRERLAERATAALERAVAKVEAEGYPVPGVPGSAGRALDALVHTCEPTRRPE